MTKTVIKLSNGKTLEFDFPGPARSADVGSVMQINRHRFTVTKCTLLETYPETLIIEGEPINVNRKDD